MAFQAKVNSAGLFKNDRYPDKSDFTGQYLTEGPKLPHAHGVVDQRLAQGFAERVPTSASR
jgi:hypothetical protein